MNRVIPLGKVKVCGGSAIPGSLPARPETLTEGVARTKALLIAARPAARGHQLASEKTTMKQIVLKPCPFCAAEARFGMESTTFTATGGRWYYVMCTRCTVQKEARTSPARAARLWNKRNIVTVKADDNG